MLIDIDKDKAKRKGTKYINEKIAINFINEFKEDIKEMDNASGDSSEKVNEMLFDSFKKKIIEVGKKYKNEGYDISELTNVLQDMLDNDKILENDEIPSTSYGVDDDVDVIIDELISMDKNKV